jgi:hypothetical protein
MKHTIVTLLKETVEYYNSNNRSVSGGGGGCKYIDNFGNMCGVGRCLRPEFLNIFHKLESDPDIVTDIGTFMKCRFFDKDIHELVKEEYSEINLADWTKIQLLHDWPENWNESGISPRGKLYIKDIFGDKIYKEVFDG